MSANLGTAWIQVKPSMDGVRGSILSGLSGTGAQFGNQMGNEVKKSSGMNVGMAAVWGAASAVAFKAIDTISRTLTDSISGAIKRVDTLNNSERTFANMGFNAAQTKESISALDKSIRGLPTPLDSAIRGMTSLAATYGDVSLGQKVFSALNNAILGFGGSTEMVDNAILQLSQLPMDGPLDAQTWNSLRNSGLTPVLVAMGKDMGKSVSTLKEEFGSGQLKVQDFTNALIKMDTEGGGGLKSLSQIAQDSTAGMSTGFANAQTAIVRGLASIISAIGSQNISSAITQIGAVFESVLKGMAAAIPPVVAGITGFVNFIVQYKDIFGPLAAGILAVVAAMVTWNAILGVWRAITVAATVVQGIFNAVMSANPISLIILAVIGLVAALTYFFTQTQLGQAIFQTFGQILQAVWNGILTGLQAVGAFFGSVFAGIQTIVGNVINFIRNNWQLLAAILFGPIGIAVGIISANFGTIKAIFQNAYSFVTGLWGQIGGFFSGIVGKIAGAFSGIAQVGRDIVNGLVSGLSPAPVINKMKEIASGALNAVKSFLGIHSPSRVMRDQVGKNIGYGMADGIEASTRSVVKSAQGQASAVLKSFSAMAGPSFGATPRLAFAGVGAEGAGGQTFNITNPSPEQTAAIVASRIKSQGGTL